MRVARPSRSQQVVGLSLPVVPSVQPCDVLEVLAQAEIVVEHRLVAEVRGCGAGLDRSDGAAEHGDGARRRLEQPRRDAQQRGLAAAVVAEQHDPLAGLDGQVQWADCRTCRRRTWRARQRGGRGRSRRPPPGLEEALPPPAPLVAAPHPPHDRDENERQAGHRADGRSGAWAARAGPARGSWPAR